MAEDQSRVHSESDLKPPAGNKVLIESRGILQIPRLMMRTPALLRGPKGSNQPALFLPGLKASDISNLPMRSFLRRQGFQTFGWELGTNHGDVERLMAPVIQRTVDLYERCGEAITLVGWSLGGILAREVARQRPELIAQVITYGTPVVGGPLYTSVNGVYSAVERREIAVRLAERNLIPINVPITALYSQRDGIVAWRACIDTFSADIEHIEIESAHIAMGIDPDVWEIVASRLAR